MFNTGVNYYYRLHGLSIKSTLPLPISEKPVPMEGDAIICREGKVAKQLMYPEFKSSEYQIKDNHVLIDKVGIARYLISNGCEIVFQRYPNASLKQVQGVLIGSCFGILAYQPGSGIICTYP